MSWKQTLEKAGPGHWVLPQRKQMRCEAHLFLSETLLFGDSEAGETGVEEEVFSQVVNACSFPGAKLYSVNHGAGRRLSRTAAKRNLSQKHTDLRMAKLGVVLNTSSTPLDESGPCYKDLEQVLGAVEMAGLAHVAHRLRPVACIKGND